MDNKIFLNNKGYKCFLDRKGNRILVHRRVMEKKLGRKIKTDHEVHHVNGNKHDNRPDNLIEVSIEEHRKIHSLRGEAE